MNHFKTKFFRGCLAIALAAFVLLPVISPLELEAGNSHCNRGLTKCLFSAAIAALSDPFIGAGLTTFCFIGYAFCLQFL